MKMNPFNMWNNSELDESAILVGAFLLFHILFIMYNVVKITQAVENGMRQHGKYNKQQRKRGRRH